VGTRRLDDSLPSDLDDVGGLHLNGAPPFFHASCAGKKKQEPSPTEAAFTTIPGSKPSHEAPDDLEERGAQSGATDVESELRTT
jgi:hypothetical protein